MKNKKITLITNLLLVIILVSVFTVGVKSERSVTILGGEISGAIYSGNESSGGVSLMFNVYENAEVVEGIIELLKQKKATATFFVGGSWADDNGKILKEIIDSNFELGNHGYFHKDHKKLSLKQNQEEIQNCHGVVKNFTGYSMNLFAPPSGSFSKTTIEVASSLGYHTIMWSKDTIDWRDSDINTIVNRATKNLKSGDLILMHPKPHTLKALPLILDEIDKKGLKTLTVTNCCSLSPIKV